MSYIGNEYYGALCYADDLTLLCPTRYGLQSMVNVCEMFGREHCVTFNVAKSYAISYGPVIIPPNHNIHMNGNPIKWLNEVNYLGNHIKSDMNDKYDLGIRTGEFIGRFNNMLANFKQVPQSVLCKLFQSHCAVWYGCQLWLLGTKEIKSAQVAWNKAIRRMFDLPYGTHCTYLPVISSLKTFEEQHIHRFCAFYKKMLSSRNGKVSQILSRAQHNAIGLCR